MRLSFSKINTFLTCPRKYYKQYILGIEEPKNEFSAFGNVCHETLQEYCEQKYTDKEMMLNIFRQQLANAENIPDNRKPYYLKEGFKIFYQFPVHEINHEQTLGVEKEITIDLDETFKLYAIIDKLMVFGDTLHVIDYKSNNAIEPQKYAHQLRLYNLATAVAFPEYKQRKGYLHYLRFNRIIPVDFSNDVEDVRQWAIKVGQTMKALEAKGTENAFPKDPDKVLCKYCMHKKECWPK